MDNNLFTVNIFQRSPERWNEHAIEVVIKGAVVNTLDDLHEQLKEPLKLPGYYGSNLDALYDVLSDLAWLNERPVHIIIYDFDYFLEGETTEKKIQTLLTFTDAGRSWLEMKESDSYFRLSIQKGNSIEQLLDTCEVGYAGK